MKESLSVAVVGAGIAGLSCAQALRAAGIKVRVLESTATAGGRCATRLWQGHLVDFGVQYFTAQSTEFKKELLTRLRQFRPIISPILDREEKVVATVTGPRFYVLQGNNYFAHVLSHGIDLQLNTPVKTVTFNSTHVDCLGESYQAVVSSLPAPLTAKLFNLDQAPTAYEPCLVALLEYPGSGIGQSRLCYARLLPAGTGPLFSSYCENNKMGRIIGDKTVFVVQASPRFSRENAQVPPEVYLPILAEENAKLWQITDIPCSASYGHLWTHGRPLDHSPSPANLPAGAFACGDSFVDSTLENVWLDGRRAAREVLAYLGVEKS